MDWLQGLYRDKDNQSIKTSGYNGTVMVKAAYDTSKAVQYTHLGFWKFMTLASKERLHMSIAQCICHISSTEGKIRQVDTNFWNLLTRHRFQETIKLHKKRNVCLPQNEPAGLLIFRSSHSVHASRCSSIICQRQETPGVQKFGRQRIHWRVLH